MIEKKGSKDDVWRICTGNDVDLLFPPLNEEKVG